MILVKTLILICICLEVLFDHKKISKSEFEIKVLGGRPLGNVIQEVLEVQGLMLPVRVPKCQSAGQLAHNTDMTPNFTVITLLNTHLS